MYSHYFIMYNVLQLNYIYKNKKKIYMVTANILYNIVPTYKI